MREVKVGGIYKHFKGHIYKVICVAYDSETLDKKVIYTDNEKYWVRDYKEFLREVDKEKYPNVEQKYRFEEVEDE